MNLDSVSPVSSGQFDSLIQGSAFDWEEYLLRLDAENLSSWNLFSFPDSALVGAIEALTALEKGVDAQKFSDRLQIMLMGLEAKKQDYTAMIARWTRAWRPDAVLPAQFGALLRDYLTKQGSCRPDYRQLVDTLTRCQETLIELKGLATEEAVLLKKGMEGLLQVDYNPPLTKCNGCLIDAFFAIPEQEQLLSLFSAINSSDFLGYGVLGERLVKQPMQLRIAILVALVKHACSTTLESAKVAIANIALGTINVLGKQKSEYLDFLPFFQKIKEFSYPYDALLIAAYKETAEQLEIFIDAKKTKLLVERLKKSEPNELHSSGYYESESFTDFCRPKVGLENQTVIDEHILCLLQTEVGDQSSDTAQMLQDLDMLLSGHINTLKMQLADLDGADFDIALNSIQDAFTTIILRGQFLLAIGKLDDAAACLDAVLSQMEDAIELSDEEKNLVYSARGYIHGQKKEFPQALEFFRKALSREGICISSDSISKSRFCAIYSQLTTPSSEWQELSAKINNTDHLVHS